MIRILSSFALLLALALPSISFGQDSVLSDTVEPICNPQQPNPILVRANYIRHRHMSSAERDRADAVHAEAIRYRTEQYGYFEGVGDPEWNSQTPRENSRRTDFMGVSIRLNERVIPALQCVEAEIRATCKDEPYQPQRYSGLRRSPTPGREISNHVYGIAIDIDPRDNTCCGCIGTWGEHELCDVETDDIFERMSMPRCWIKALSLYGWYWYGHEDIQDTMHFDFLGNPDAIYRRPDPSDDLKMRLLP